MPGTARKRWSTSKDYDWPFGQRAAGQMSKMNEWMNECDSSLNLMLKASDDVPQSWPCKFLPFWHAGMLSNSHHESSPFRNWWILSSWWTPRRMKLPQRSICRSKYASLSTNHCNLLISLILFVSLTISTSWSWGPYQSEAWLQVRSTNLENSHSPGWALTRKHPAGHRRPENLGEEIFLKPPGLFGVFLFWPRQLGRLKSEIVRLQKVLEDTQDYLGLPQDNQNAFRNRKTSGPKDFNSQKITRLRITASQKKNNCSKSKMVLTNVRSNVWRLSDSVFSAFRIKSMPSPMSSWEEMRSWTSELPPFFFH